MGDYIKRLRESKKMTQDDLALLIKTDRSTISKYERGVLSVPIDIIKKLSTIFDVSISDIILGTNKNETLESIYVDNINMKKKIKKCSIIIIIFIIITILLLSIYYFITNFNAYKIYNLSIDNQNIKTNNSTLTITPSSIFLSINDVEYNNSNIDCIELYYKNNNEKHLISKVDNTNSIFIRDYSDYQEYFDFNNLNSIINNLYIKIYTNDETLESKINLYNTFINNSFFIKNNYGFIDNNNKNTVLDDINEKFKINYNSIDYDVSIDNNDIMIASQTELFVISNNEVLLYYIKENNDFKLLFTHELNNKNYNKDYKKYIQKYYELKKEIDYYLTNKKRYLN